MIIVEQRLMALMDFFLKNISEGYLAQLFGDQVFGDGYNYLENAKTIFLRSSDSPRKVVCNLFYNRDRQNLPTIHIALNDESLGQQGNGLGFDPYEQFDVETQRFTETLSRTYSSRYNIICTSDNTFEVLIMYNVVKALFQGNPVLLAAAGLENIKVGGHDLILTDYLMPPTIYARGFFIDCLFDVVIPPFTFDGQGVEGIAHVFMDSVCGKSVDVLEEENKENG